MTIGITGGAGFIGSNVLLYLFEKYPQYHFIVLDALTYAGNMKNIPDRILNSKRFSFWYGDIRNASLVDEFVRQSDVIIHFAAETHVTRSINDNAKFFETDVLGTQVIANAVLKHKKTVDRFIHISTCEVYGEGLTKKMNEDHPLNPQSPYAAAKAGADRLVYSYHRTYSTPSIIVRPFNVFGPRQHLEKVVPRFITSTLLSEPLTVHGSGGYGRDFLYVEDLARAIDLLVHAPKEDVIGEVFNVGSGKCMSILELAMKISPSQNILNVGDRPGQVSNFSCDYSKIQKLLGWESTTSFKDGLQKTVDWYQSRKDVWESQMWMRQVPITTVSGKIEMH